VANPTIKPDDLATTPTGRTVRCEALNPDGSREVCDVVTGEKFDILPKHLTVIMVAPVRPWVKRRA
jgi:hypothetical protein